MQKTSMQRMVSLAVLVCIAFVFFGCAKVNSRVPKGLDLTSYDKFYVVRHTEGEIHIDEMIRDELRALGINAYSGPPAGKPEDTAIVVNYEDRWYWDITMYLLSLTIDFEEADTGLNLLTGQSTRPSLERKPAEFMVNEILASIFASIEPQKIAAANNGKSVQVLNGHKTGEDLAGFLSQPDSSVDLNSETEAVTSYLTQRLAQRGIAAGAAGNKVLSVAVTDLTCQAPGSEEVRCNIKLAARAGETDITILETVGAAENKSNATKEAIEKVVFEFLKNEKTFWYLRE